MESPSPGMGACQDRGAGWRAGKIHHCSTSQMRLRSLQEDQQERGEAAQPWVLQGEFLSWQAFWVLCWEPRAHWLKPGLHSSCSEKRCPPRRKTPPEECIYPYFHSLSHSGKSPFLNADITLSSPGKYSCSCRWLNQGSSEKVPVNRVSHRDCSCADFRAPANAKQNVPAGWLELMCFALHLHLAQSLTEASCWGKSDKELSSYYSTACKYLLHLWWEKKSCRKSTPLSHMETENDRDLVHLSSSLLSVAEVHTPRGNSHFSVTRIMNISASNVIHLEKAWSLP